MKIPFPKYEAEVVEEIEAYLDMDYQTEITQRAEHPSDGLVYLFARGFAASDREGTRNPSNYARAMIQPIPDGAFSGSGVRVTPCQCDRFDQSWNCELHPPIDWDPVRRRWKRPCTGDRERCNCDPCYERRQRAQEQSNGYTDMGTDGLRPPQGLIDSYLQQLRAIQENTRPETVLRIRPSDHSYEATVLRDNRSMQEAVMTEASREAARTGWPVRAQVLGRWARIHADGSLIFERTPGEMARGSFENTYGLVRSPGQIIAEERRRRETRCTCSVCCGGAEAVNPVRTIDLSSVPEALMGPSREIWASRLEALQDATLTVNLEGTFDPSVLAALRAPRTLEIESETEQGAGPLAIEVEPGDGSAPAP